MTLHDIREHFNCSWMEAIFPWVLINFLQGLGFKEDTNDDETEDADYGN